MKRIKFMEVNSNEIGPGELGMIVVRSFLSMLGLLTILSSTALDVSAQETRGRMVSPRQSEAQKSNVSERREEVAVEDAETTLSRILEVERNSFGFFDNKIIRVEVSENALRFKFDETPLHPDGAPAYGNEFVTEGYIYRKGTLINGSDGVNPDGSPEFPRKVIGRWTCRGWHVGEGAKTLTGPWVVTHQLFDFGNQAGRVTLTTDGVELVDFDVPVLRAIIGGTGQYSSARGEARQIMTSFNKLNGVVLQIELKVEMK